MFTISFKKSRSKNYKQVLDIASNFRNYKVVDDVNIVDMTVKELFEKWEFFNLLFWRTVDWKGATFRFDDCTFHSHCDKTQIFYALQQSHTEWINMYTTYSSKMYKVYKEQMTIEEARAEVFTEKEIDRIIDRFLRAAGRFNYYEQFGHLNFEAPLANSDFFGRRIRRMIKEQQEDKDKSDG